MRIYNLILITLLLHTTFIHSFFKSKVARLQKKAKDVYKKYATKEKKWNFMGIDPNLYPGINPEIRQENAKLWERYYQCLNEQAAEVGEHGIPIPEAIQGFQGGHVKLAAKFCVNPKESNRDDIEWYFGEVGKTFLSIIFYSDHVFIAPEDKSLHIYNLQEEHSGQYMCVLGENANVPYYLNVVSGENQLKLVHDQRADKGPYALESVKVSKYDLEVDTEWGAWSKCSQCGKVGRKHKLGYCIITSSSKQDQTIQQQTKEIILNENFKFQPSNTKYDIEIENHILSEHIALVQTFQFGIPCKSFILPKSIQNLPEVKSFSDQIMIGYCQEQCDKSNIFIVRDRDGKEIERANNSAGIYSTLQGIPPGTPEVQRIVYYEKRGKDVIIACPGNLNTDAPIKWMTDGKEIIPEIIAEESNGRIYISLMDRIHLKNVKLSDSKMYSCWQNNELAGTVRLEVDNRLQFSFNHHIMLISMILILSVFVYVFLKALTNRKHARLYVDYQ